MTITVAPVWLVTGCSTGIGREIALAALRKGHRVVVTARNPATVADLAAAPAACQKTEPSVSQSNFRAQGFTAGLTLNF